MHISMVCAYLFVVCVGFAGGGIYARTSAKLKKVHDMRMAIHNETMKVKHKNEQRQTEISGLKDPLKLDQIARKYGWVLDGEHPIRLRH